VETPTPSKSARRREEFLEAAGDLFLRNGFDNVSIDDIIARSGGSKTSIYRDFGGKEALFSASILQRCKRTLQPIMHPLAASEDPAATLLNFGVQFLKCVLSEDGISCHRIVMAESKRFPEVGQAFYAAGPQTVYQALSRIFLRLDKQSRIPKGSADALARHFHGMILTELQMGRLLANAPMPDDAQLRSHVKRAIRALLSEP
jgi:AcrR family transcriptional regulator